MKINEKPMKTYEKPMTTYGKQVDVLSVLLHIARREAPRRNFECFYYILRGAKRRGEFLSVSLHIMRREAPWRKFDRYSLIPGGAKRRRDLFLWILWYFSQQPVFSQVTEDPMNN